MNKQILVGMLNSKTINVNVILTTLIIGYATSNGIPLSPELATAAVAGLYGISNVILRFFTNKSLPDKGISIPNPVYVKEFTKAIGNDGESVKEFTKAIGKNEDAVKELYTALHVWIQKEKEKRKK